MIARMLATHMLVLLGALTHTSVYSHPPDTNVDRARVQVGASTVRPDFIDAFRQLEEILPTPNDARTASGAPGRAYWQQQADHDIAVTISADASTATGTERITYHNRSPDDLRYLWLQLDQNRFDWNSRGELSTPAPDFAQNQGMRWLDGVVRKQSWSGGYSITRVALADGAALPFTIVDTMMRVDLPTELVSGESLAFDVAWTFPIVDVRVGHERSNSEFLEADNAPIVEMAQFFPRMAAYTDVNGWQHKAFLGRGEFTTEFGDFTLAVTVPDNWTVVATGELTNAKDVLTTTQQARYAEAKLSERPIMITNAAEAAVLRAQKSSATKTWRFDAKQVRDCAFAASPAYLWDGARAPIPGTDRAALAMSVYPIEAEPLWSKYSTHAVAHTIDSYSRHALPYPYPIAISANGPVGGMEYPMICFNGPRPEKDGTYSEGTKKGLIGVVIHEVGHNWFPMIINSDERQWTWLDEGLNTFCQYLAEQEWAEKYESGRGEPHKIVEYMTTVGEPPIMTNSESIARLGPNAYAKPATALNVLRETILGRENFDFAFREYCRRWAFKRPQPADFFRTMEDASGVDLDWFWRAWFYDTRAVDVAIEEVIALRIKSMDPAEEKAIARAERDGLAPTLSDDANALMNAAHPPREIRFPELQDFYSSFDQFAVSDADRKSFEEFAEKLTAHDRALLKTTLSFTLIRFRNDGGLITPLPLEMQFADGTSKSVVLPAELWKLDPRRVSKLIVSASPVVKVTLDKHRQIADADITDNAFPQEISKGSIGITNDRRRGNDSNPMREALEQTASSASRKTAAALAAVIATAVKAGRSASSAFDADATSLNDAWGKRFLIIDGGKNGAIATIVSCGPDGIPSNRDDVSFHVNADGTLAE